MAKVPTKIAMAPLVSRWATDEDSVNKAIDQDEKVKTIKKGQPLVSKWASPISSEKGRPLPSRWADEEDSNTEPSTSPGRQNHRQHHHRQHHRQHRDHKRDPHHREDQTHERTRHNETSKDFKGGNDLANRLGGLNISSAVKLEDKEQELEDEIEESEHGQLDEEVDDRTAPTKGAQDFASRLGISLNVPTSKSSHSNHKPRRDKGKESARSKRNEEREKIRTEKSHRGTEWDKGKPGQKVDYTIERESLPAMNTFDDEQFSKMLEGKVDWAEFEEF